MAQTAVNDSRGSAGSSGREVVLLQNQSANTAPGTLTGNGHTVNAAANYYDVEFLVEEFVPLLTHRQIRWVKLFQR
jgi:hypothetical protein